MSDSGGFSGSAEVRDLNGVRFAESPIALLLLDDTFAYVDVNAAAVALLKYSRDELIGMPLQDHLEGVPADEYKSMGRLFRLRGEAAGFYKFRKADGQRINCFAHTIANVSPGRHLVHLEPRPD